MIGHIFRIGSKIKHTQGHRTHQGARGSIFPNSPDYGRNISKTLSLKMPWISPYPPDFFTFLRSCPCGINLKWRVPWVAPLKKLPSKNLAQKCLCNSGMLTMRSRPVGRPANLDGRGVMQRNLPPPIFQIELTYLTPTPLSPSSDSSAVEGAEVNTSDHTCAILPQHWK